ncbi:protein-L-isoaspartate(D-aspartate) O-methyltransferase [Bdellovibrionota bacterium]
MIETQLKSRNITDERVLEAMEKIPREEFVPEALRSRAYEDGPLPIGKGQTISQPYIVALMTELLQVKPTERVLEIGTGSGYQTAVISEIAREIYTIEIVRSLFEQAKERLNRLGFSNIHFKPGDGYKGWIEHSPFDKIILTAAPPKIPRPLLEQLSVGGRLVAPVGEFAQNLNVYTKKEEGEIHQSETLPVRFVPMVGEAQKRKKIR